MKRLISIATALAFVLALVTPAFAGEPAAGESVKGWIVDSDCGAKNANAKSADCIKTCYKGGAKLVLVAGEKTYGLSDQKMAFDHIGHEVVVTGTVDKDGNLAVKKIEEAKKDKA